MVNAKDMKHEKLLSDRYADLACVFVIFILSAICFYPYWARGSVFVPSDLMFNQEPWASSAPGFPGPWNHEPSDAIQQHFPWRMFYHREIRRGAVPLWNPHQFCGAPFAANDQSAVFYPLNAIIYRYFHAPDGYTVSAWLHLFLSGLFLFMLLRFEGAGRAGGLFGAVVFMFNGCHVVWMAHAAKQSAMVWTPLLLLLAGIAIRRRSAAAAALVAPVTAILLTAGFLQFESFALFILGAYLVFQAAVNIRNAAAWRYTGLVVLSACLGLIMAAVHVWPVLELAADAARPAVHSVHGWFPGVPLKYLVLLIRPDHFGSPVDSIQPLGFPYTEYNFFVSLPALLLCVAAAAGAFSSKCSRREQSSVAFYALMSVFGLAAMLGTPAYALYYYLVPGAKTLEPSRIGYVFTFAVSVLSGIGAMGVLRMAFRDSAQIEWTRGRGRAMRGAVAAVMVLIAALAIMPWAVRFNTFSDIDITPPRSRAVDFLINVQEPARVFSPDPDWTLFPDLATLFQLDDIRGYDSLYPKRSRLFMNALQDAWGRPAAGGRTRRESTIADAPAVFAAAPLDWLNVRHIITRQKISLPWYRAAEFGGMRVYENGRAYRRLFFSNGFVTAKNSETALELSTTQHIEISRDRAPLRPELQVVLEEKPEFPPANSGPLPKRNSYKIVGWRAGGIELKVDAAHQTLLFMSESYDPGWRAMLDGRHVKILRANYNFRAVAVPAGMHRLRLWYSPLSARAGLALSLAALAAAAAAFAFFSTIRGRRKPFTFRASYEK